MPVRTLITDDEPLARERLVSMLQGEPDIQIVGQCSDGRSALSFVEKQRVDLVLLDIQMPEMDGFAMVRQIPAERMPAIIFVTVYDQYALDAFEVHAVDYLLKPVEETRLQASLNRVREAHRLQSLGTGLHPRIAAMLTELESRRSAPDRILLKSDGQITFFDPEEIDWIESAGNYVTLHLGGKTTFLRESLVGLQKKLRPYGFVRISRSVIVNTARIRTMKSIQYGDYSIQLLDATQLTLNRGYREAFFDLVDKPQ